MSHQCWALWATSYKDLSIFYFQPIVELVNFTVAEQIWLQKL